ncbi:MAG: hypothetical protein HQ564_10230 [Candidatus Saganbacteria bacterium]|nr:hypothetical protein [Candidatus Saganbacteria bacterium]
MTKKLLAIFVICGLSFGISAQAALDIAGTYENDFMAYLKKDGSGGIGDLNRLRLKIDVRTSRDLSLHLEPRFYHVISSENIPITGVSDLDKMIFDKAYIKTHLSQLSLTYGKQRIAWGTGYIWNPTDIFNPYVLSFAVGQEDETNVEAVRSEISVGEASGIDAFILNDSSRSGVRAKTNIGLFDFSASYVDLSGSGFQWGVDFAGEFGIGIRGEAIVRYPYNSARYFQGILGCDYTFENGIYVNSEYFYNGLGNNSLYLGINNNLDEITKISGSTIINLDDQSFLIYPSYSRNVAENVDVSIESMVLGGQEGTEYNRSEFGGSKLGFVRVKYSF